MSKTVSETVIPSPDNRFIVLPSISIGMRSGFIAWGIAILSVMLILDER